MSVQTAEIIGEANGCCGVVGMSEEVLRFLVISRKKNCQERNWLLVA